MDIKEVQKIADRLMPNILKGPEVLPPGQHPANGVISTARRKVIMAE